VNVSTSETIETTVPGVVGERVDDAEIEIDYSIIEHFSQHLYSSPHKAIEELVSNSFDALATEAHVYVPGAQVHERVVVWDDGDSMDVEGLKELWWIARSPKDVGERIARNERVGARKMIGKFGIGKVATYQLGRRISHLCKVDGRFFLVTVDYSNILPEDRHIDPREDERVEERAPILLLDEFAAERWARAQFMEEPNVFAGVWAQESWTLAVVDRLRAGVDIPQGRLRWVLGLSMPLRPDFAVRVNDEPVTPRLLTGAVIEWDVGAPKVQEALRSEWADALKAGAVHGDLAFRTDDGADWPTVVLPELKEVRADVSIFAESLARGAAAEHGRSYGFFLMVRDRLINPQDPLLLLHDPSYGTFYRTQWVVRADELDADLLADRERIHRATPRAAELAVVQRALYLAAREKVQELDQAAQHERSSEALLPIASREHYRDPLAALLLRVGEDTSKFHLGDARIERKNLEVTEPVADIDAESSSFVVNAKHPFLDAVASRLGSGKKAREALRALDLVAVSELLLEGFLLDLGLTEEQVDRVLAWRDGLLRQMARRYQAAPEAAIEDVIAASYLPGKPFEDALAKLFGLMGFDAFRDGRSKHKDVLVIAPIGSEEFRFTVEAKGSKNKIGNDAAEIDIAAAHRDGVQATHAIVVAREFVGFEGSATEPAMILQQCETTKRVSIVTVEALIALYRAVQEFYYPLEIVFEVLRPVEAPAEKLGRIGRLAQPLDDFDFRALLDEAWKKQRGTAAGDTVPYRQLWQENWKSAIPDVNEFTSKLAALETLALNLIRLDTQQQTVRLLQSPDIIAEKAQRSLEARDAPTDTTPAPS
jgi:Histidine kinase-, DNA gyrase B-, and HSP90-like ATPase/Restriction endonuclease